MSGLFYGIFKSCDIISYMKKDLALSAIIGILTGALLLVIFQNIKIVSDVLLYLSRINIEIEDAISK